LRTVYSMYFVYIIKSKFDDSLYYGFTGQDVFDRLEDHNKGDCDYTAKHRPWKLIWFAGFETKQQAMDFERYLKSGSGKAFARKRLIENSDRV